MKRKVLIVIASIIVISYGAMLCAQYYKQSNIPEAAWECLNHPKELILYSICPEPKLTPKDNEVFSHGFKVLGSAAIKNKKDQNVIISEVTRAISTLFAMESACFNPRHCVRVTDGRIVYDFLICYECNYIALYSGEEKIAGIQIRGSGDALNEILKKANVPLPEQAK
jgi:hypothetical protein